MSYNDRGNLNCNLILLLTPTTVICPRLRIYLFCTVCFSLFCVQLFKDKYTFIRTRSHACHVASFILIEMPGFKSIFSKLYSLWPQRFQVQSLAQVRSYRWGETGQLHGWHADTPKCDSFFFSFSLFHLLCESAPSSVHMQPAMLLGSKLATTQLV